MAFNLGGLLGNFIPDSYGLSDKDKTALAKQGLLASGLAMLASKSGGNFGQSFGEGLQSGLLAINRGANSVGEQRYRQQAMQQQLGGGTDFRALDAKARAAGYEPGTDDYKRAFQVALGTEGRASNAGYGFFEFEGADGRKRMGRNNPRTGEREVYDEAAGEFVPLGGIGDGVPTAPPATPGFGIAETDNYVRKILSNVAVDPNATPEQQAAQLLPALIQQESGGNAAAVSPKGAVGLTQVMPATGADPGFGVSPLRDSSPQENVRFGRDYLTAMLKRYPGRPDLALAAYNAGPGVADRFASPQASARPGIATGRRPEDEAAAVAAATLPYQMAEIDARTNAGIRQADAAGRLGVRDALDTASGKAVIEGGAEADKKRASNSDALRQYETAISGLKSGLGGATTNPLIGSLPAITANQQIAQGSVAAVAPVLKQLFRTAGEGNFTDADQKLLMDMIPTRMDLPEARAAKMANIDAIVRAKLSSGTPAPAARGGSAAKPAPRRLKFNPATGKIE